MSKKTTIAQARERAISLIRNADRHYLATHIRPDGDALGSLLALALALQALGKQVAALCADPVPPTYRFLPGASRISPQPPGWTADLGIVLDCDGLLRVGPLAPAFERLPHLVDIDHHATDRTFGQARLIDPSAGATAEIVYSLLAHLGADISPEIATCLYVAILTDTGRFCYGNTTPDSFRIASELVTAGADPHDTARRIYEERSLAATHLLGTALTRLSPNHHPEIVSSLLLQRDFADTGAQPTDTEGIIDHLRAIGGRRVAILFVEEEGPNVRVSLRSDGSVDVSEIALSLGGGGHAMAAGCRVAGAPDDVQATVLAAVRRALQSAKPPHGA